MYEQKWQLESLPLFGHTYDIPSFCGDVLVRNKIEYDINVVVHARSDYCFEGGEGVPFLTFLHSPVVLGQYKSAANYKLARLRPDSEI